MLLAGVPIPEGMQGRSWRPLLLGESPAWRDAFVYEYQRDSAKPFVPSILALRTRDAKLIRYPDHPEWTELFDLARDPMEIGDLAADPAHATQRARLEQQLDALDSELGPRAP